MHAGAAGREAAIRTISRLEYSFARLPNANPQLMLDALLLVWPRVEGV